MKMTQYASPELVLLNEVIVPEASVQGSARLSAGLKTDLDLLQVRTAIK
jgi:hypothetical protein